MGHFCSCGHYMTSFPWHALLRRELHFPQINGSRSGVGGNRAGRGRGAAACRGGLRFGQDGSVRRASLRPCIPPSVRPSVPALRGAHGAPRGRRRSAVPALATSCASAERQRCRAIGCHGRGQLHFAAEAEMLPVLWPLPAASAVGE